MWWRTILLIAVVCVSRGDGKTTSSAIPDALFDCYRSNFTISSRPPLTISLLIELLRKVELDESSALNLRLLVTSILHGVIFDGVRRYPRISDDDLGVPYRATGEHFNKYKLLVDYLTSGESSLFPADSLTTAEFCFLHKLVSNTVDPWQRGDESSTCLHRSLMPSNLELMSDSETVSACPIKEGNVKTAWGSVSPGHIVAGVAAALQQTMVTFERVEEAINSNENANTTTVASNSNTVNNVWVSAIVADLAEVILEQAKTALEFGVQGFWNDTLLPRVFYLNSNKWSLSEAEILGGIDALIIASNVQKWYDSTKRIRLSQLIDMYYSERGIVYDAKYKASSRSSTLNKLLEGIDLEEQIKGTARLLQNLHPYEQYLRENEIAQLSAIMAEKFKQIAANITKAYDSVEYVNGKQMKSPVELIVILDGSYDPYTSEQFIYAISEAIQVSHYGSKLGIINGQSGDWMVPVTGHLFRLFADLHQNQNWPSTLALGRSLESVMYYYENETTSDCSNRVIRPKARAILIINPEGRLTDNDLTRSLRAFNAVKSTHPEVSFLLVSSNGGIGSNFWDNDHVLSPLNDVLSLVEHVTATLADMPGNIINFYCNQSQMRSEDYITPEMETFYQIRQEHVRKGHIKTTFSNSNYGDLYVCAGGDFKSQKKCKDVTVNGEISFDSRELCAGESACNLQYVLSVNDSKRSCTENDCRFPDQVRLNIFWERSSANRIRLSWLLVVVLVCAIYRCC